MNIEELLFVKKINASANEFFEDEFLRGELEQIPKKEFNLFELVLGVAEGKYVEDYAEMTDKGLLCWASRYVEEELGLEDANEDIFDILLYYDYKPSIKKLEEVNKDRYEYLKQTLEWDDLIDFGNPIRIEVFGNTYETEHLFFTSLWID